jgi:hypothetical protein
VFRPLPRAAVQAVAGRDGEVPRYVVHLAVIAVDLAGAGNLACALARSLAFMPELDVGETRCPRRTLNTYDIGCSVT